MKDYSALEVDSRTTRVLGTLRDYSKQSGFGPDKGSRLYRSAVTQITEIAEDGVEREALKNSLSLARIHVACPNGEMFDRIVCDAVEDAYSLLWKRNFLHEQATRAKNGLLELADFEEKISNGEPIDDDTVACTEANVIDAAYMMAKNCGLTKAGIMGVIGHYVGEEHVDRSHMKRLIREGVKHNTRRN